VSQTPLLEVHRLTKRFETARGPIEAVREVSFQIGAQESVGLVGESGCGKTTTARCIVRLETATEGDIRFGGDLVSSLGEAKFRPYRKKIQMVFQDPVLSLNPLFTVRRTLEEPLLVHRLGDGRQRAERIAQTMALVNLDRAFLSRYPQQLSGGQCQRVGIARAVITNPALVVLDEPTSWLDMSTRVQIIRLLRDLQERIGMAYLFISHDLSTIRHVCQRVVVMYLGRVVEVGRVEQVYSQPRHPYTYALLSAVPIPDPTVRRQRLVLPGEPPAPTNGVPGCAFATRCPYARERCWNEPPELREVAPGQNAACHFAEDWPTAPAAVASAPGTVGTRASVTPGLV
jgi:oligopeptide transport system ATP-binding protein